MIQILVSACLLGEKVRYHGGSAMVESPVLARWLREGRVVPFCPEVAGGLGVPRPPAEIDGTDGHAVLDGGAVVITTAGADVSAALVRGARMALDTARAQGVRIAVLKDGSPSCGSESIYDGTFSGTKRRGRGVTAALLERHGIRVFDELHLDEASAYLEELEKHV